MSTFSCHLIPICPSGFSYGSRPKKSEKSMGTILHVNNYMDQITNDQLDIQLFHVLQIFCLHSVHDEHAMTFWSMP